ncbi:protein TPX2-like isoform X2 [Tripterygium wilfordii]|uniref:protein TPX2-like isoform X2 n=1 Tax=Tripterygium wilfordii TaxID=458696 RepID=UPI0018F817FD|nr:protein TPX2-like isoform X2 [Tripterygium wilfordii]
MANTDIYTKMDELVDFDEFVEDPSVVEEIDFDYEFDAPRFYDFTLEETFFDILEANRWFNTLTGYPPSPFAVILMAKKSTPVESAKFPPKCKFGDANSISDNKYAIVESEVSVTYDSIRGSNFDDYMVEDLSKTDAKSPQKSSFSRSSFMKPTASQLAKQNQSQEVRCSRLYRRCPTNLGKIQGKSSLNACLIETQATKRQKLEAGYLRKAASWKHQALFLHKVRNLDVSSAHARPKLTIPRQPDLETMARARRHRSKINSELGECEQSNPCTFKARPLNRKIFKAPSLSFPRKSTPQLPEFRVFHLRTMERAMQHASSNASKMCIPSSTPQNQTADRRRVKYVDILKEKKPEKQNNYKACSHDRKKFSNKERIGVIRNIGQETRISIDYTFPTDKKFQEQLPIELFSKLSLSSGPNSHVTSEPNIPWHPKGAKENVPGSLYLEHEMMNIVKEKSSTFDRNQSLCGGERKIHEIVPRMNINRSLDIR